MFDDLTAVLVVFAIVFGFVALRFIKLKSQTSGQMSTQDVTALERMAEVAQILETRVATLERILDTESPSWRDDPAHFYQQASHER